MNDSPTTATALLRLNPSTKSQIASFRNQIVTAIEEGESNPLEVLVQCRAIEKAVEEILPKIQAYILKEADKYPEKSFDFLGNKLEKGEAGVKYNYAATNDPIWEQLDADVNTATDRRKEREAFLRAIKAGDIVKAVDPSTGEEVTLRPAPKTSTSIVKVSIQ
jgi:hypothetical protein